MADAFIAIHADGNDDTSVSGYKVVGSGFDESGRSSQLELAIDRTYSATTHMDTYDEVPASMREYYAFNRKKFKHTIASTTPGVVLELGFLTNSADRAFITNKSNEAAHGLAQGIVDYLKNQGITQ
jgi:N-acetylmuramoyl-L-alanine amidase